MPLTSLPRIAEYCRPAARPLLVSFPRAEERLPAFDYEFDVAARWRSRELLGLAAPVPRNIPRRRFTYGWGYQLVVRRALQEAAGRLGIGNVRSRRQVCAPVGGLAVAAPLLSCPEPAGLPWRAMTGIDAEVLTGLTPGGPGAVRPGSLHIQHLPPAGAPARPMPQLAGAETERRLPLRESTRSLPGFFVPQVTIAPLRPAITFGPRPATTSVPGYASGDRRGVVIPIREFLAAPDPRPASQPARARTS